MTAYDHRLASAASSITAPLSRAVSSLARSVGAGLRRVQYAQMVSVLHRMSDRHLNDAGIRRRDIPELARRLVYGDD